MHDKLIGEMRRQIMEELSALDATFPTLIHPSAVIGSRVTIGEGTVVKNIKEKGTYIGVPARRMQDE